MKWKKIKEYPNYLINENGDIYSIKTDIFLKPHVNISGVKYVGLSRKGKCTTLQLAILVLDAFKPSQTQLKRQAWHNDLELSNVSNPNLERCTRGDRKRMFNEIKGKKRGVYAYNGSGKNKFRVLLRNKDKKVVTIGYYKTALFAQLRYVQAYKKEFGRMPY